MNIADLDIPVNAVTTALKDFLKRLPPILSPDCMQEIIKLSQQYSDTGGVLTDIRSFLLSLPNANYQIIHFLVDHLAK